MEFAQRTKLFISRLKQKDDQALCHLSIKTKALLNWESLKVQGQSYTEILNNNIPCGAFKINSNCERLQNRLKAEVSRAKMKLKKLNRNGTKQQREKFYNGRTRLAILNSDIVTAEQLQDTVRSLETKNNNLKKSNCHLKNQVQNLANQYTNLESSTRMSVEKITEKTQAEINKEKENNNRMYVRIRELERLEGCVPTGLGCLGNISIRQRRRKDM